MLGLPQAVIAHSDPYHPLASSIKNSMPLGAGSVYSRPAVHNDGSIEYKPVDAGPPPEVNGYTRDEFNPWLFHPLWPECQLRMAGVRKAPNGAIDLKMVCNNPVVKDHFMRFVKSDDCAACTQRKNPAQPEG